MFPDPEEYRPSRWYEGSGHEVTLFGIGPRACIGRKFATSEALCFLSRMLRDWKVDVILQDGESRKGYEERVMTTMCKLGLSFGVGQIKLKFTKRM